jgi:hypothetical protein
MAYVGISVSFLSSTSRNSAPEHCCCNILHNLQILGSSRPKGLIPINVQRKKCYYIEIVRETSLMNCVFVEPR